MRREHLLLGVHHDHGRSWRSRPLGEGDTLLAVALSSIGVWIFHYLIARGVKEAATINRIVTIAKLVPIFVFIIAVGLVVQGRTVPRELLGGEEASFSTLVSTK